MNLGKTCESLIIIRYRGKETARIVDSAISPDNLTTPESTKITTSVNVETLRISVTSTKLPTLIATLDDLLSCIQAAESAIMEINSG
jgi:tRNA threonylcarbamoyladenosine modification (KEOPS) complex  Pcc1 subunit